LNTGLSDVSEGNTDRTSSPSQRLRPSLARPATQAVTPPPVPEKPEGYTPSPQSRIPTPRAKSTLPTPRTMSSEFLPPPTVRRIAGRSRVGSASVIRSLFRRRGEVAQRPLMAEAQNIIGNAITAAQSLSHPRSDVNDRVRAYALVEHANVRIHFRYTRIVIAY
jgi:hypothetical protein